MNKQKKSMYTNLNGANIYQYYIVRSYFMPIPSELINNKVKHKYITNKY